MPPQTPLTVLPTHLLLSLPRPPCVPTPFKITCCNKEASALILQTRASVFEGKWEKSKAHLPLSSPRQPLLSADVPAKCACAPAGIPEAGEQKPRPTSSWLSAPLAGWIAWDSVTLTADKAPRPAALQPGLLVLISPACQRACPHLLLAQPPWAQPCSGLPVVCLQPSPGHRAQARP